MPAERLDYAERWMLDGLRTLRPSFVAYETSADMTNALRQLEELRKSGVSASVTHQVVRAAARALAANRGLHQLISRTHRHRPSRIDIGLSIAGEIFLAPVLVIEGADQKSIAEIAEETTRRTPEVRKADAANLQSLRKWGWLVPSSTVRRWIMRRMFAGAAFRRQTAGTFQVSTVPMDSAATSVFVAAGVLVAGRVWPRVIAIDGQPAVRPMMTLTLSGDHGVWDGRAAARFLAVVKSELEADASSDPKSTVLPAHPQ